MVATGIATPLYAQFVPSEVIIDEVITAPETEVMPKPDQEPTSVPEPEPEKETEEMWKTAPTIDPNWNREDCKGGAVECSTKYLEAHPEANEIDDPYWYMDPPTEGLGSELSREEYIDQVKYRDQNNIHTVEEYIRFNTGICPSQQDRRGGFWDSVRHVAALGLFSYYPKVEHTVESYWQNWKLGKVFNPVYVPEWEGHRQIPLDIEWDTLTATSDTAPALAQEFTSYLRKIDADYNVLCPNDLL